MDDLAQIRRVTDNYVFWQGLRWVPFGVLLLLQALVLAWPGARPLAEWWTDGLLLALLLVCWLAYRWIDGWYARTFGQVSAIRGRHRGRDAVKWLLVYPALGVSLVVDALVRPPLLVSGAVWGAAVLAYWASTGRGRTHYLWAAMLLVACTFLPLLDIVDRGAPMVALLLAVVGAVYVVGGMLDHCELARLLPRAREGLDG
jgi:hypothetical protein